LNRIDVRPAPSLRSTRRILFAVFVFAFLLYLPTLRNGFVWDDNALIENFDVRTLDASTVKRIFTTNFWEASETQSGMYRPLTALSFHIDYQLHDSRPAGFHLTNALLNAAVCALLFLLLLEMFGRFDVALMSALFYAAFPMHAENVAWVSGRTDVLATLFMLASLWCWARWRNVGGVLALAGIFVFHAAALLAKEIAVVLPAVVATASLVSLRTSGASRPPRDRFVIAGMFVMVAMYFVLRREVLGSALLYFPRFTEGAAQAVALTLSIVAHYAYKLVFPYRLDAEADFMPPATLWNLHTLVGAVFVVAAAYSLYRWRRNPAFVFSVAVIACGLAPVLNILPLNQVLAERFLYFPSIGHVLLVSLAVASAMKRWRTAALAVFLILIAACSARTVARTFDWKDELTLFQKTVAVSGDNARARASLGGSLFARGRYEEALAEFRRATELNPSYAPGWSGLARTAGKLGQVDEALEDMQTAVNLDPNNALFYHNLGVLQFQARRYAEAAESFRRALELRPRHFHARFNLGLALYQQSDFSGAVRELTALENKDTDFVNAWFFIAESEARRGHQEEAARAATHFLSLHHADDAMTARAREIAATK